MTLYNAGDKMIRYLGEEEKKITRTLYEEAFPEDGKDMIDFFCSSRLKENRVLADVENGEIRTMIHMDPYEVMVCGKIFPLYYLVAISTQKEYRRQGLMRGVMDRLLNDLRREHCPFVFLEPADPAYYTAFDFSYISRREKNTVDPLQRKRIIEKDYQPEMCDAVVRFTNRWLRDHAEVYCVRDAHYIGLLLGEIEAGDGAFRVLFDGQGGDVAGTAAYDYPDTAEEEARLILRDDLVKKTGRKVPFMMARITDLYGFIRLFSWKEDLCGKEVKKEIHITDPVIPENNGVFSWFLSNQTSRLQKEDVERERDGSAAAEKDIPEFTIAELTSWLFGYSVCEKASWCGNVRTVHGVYFDEGF